jgi:hypothetical protein
MHAPPHPLYAKKRKRSKQKQSNNNNNKLRYLGLRALDMASTIFIYTRLLLVMMKPFEGIGHSLHNLLLY